jgi:hypothetical protein
MKSKFNIKLLFLILTLIFLIATIILIRTTYARYVTSLTTTSYVELGKWLIFVNDQNIIENSDISDIITPVFTTNSEYIAEGKIVPTSTGYVEITIDYEEVNVPFKYEISYEYDADTILEDFNFTSYSINGGEEVSIESTGGFLTDTIYPDETLRTKTLKLNLAWKDGEGEQLDDTADTTYSHNIDELGIRFNMEFTQLQPSS